MKICSKGSACHVGHIKACGAAAKKTKEYLGGVFKGGGGNIGFGNKVIFPKACIEGEQGIVHSRKKKHDNRQKGKHSGRLEYFGLEEKVCYIAHRYDSRYAYACKKTECEHTVCLFIIVGHYYGRFKFEASY